MKSVFHFKNGTPRQPAVCSYGKGSITVDKSVFNNPEHSLEGLEEFSHVWIIFLFHKNNNVHTKAKVKPPRLDGKRVGVFSTRSPYRPNAIGLTLATIEKIQDATVYVTGVDILDGTPILDIKPYILGYDAPVHLTHLDEPDTAASGGSSREHFTYSEKTADQCKNHHCISSIESQTMTSNLQESADFPAELINQTERYQYSGQNKGLSITSREDKLRNTGGVQNCSEGGTTLPSLLPWDADSMGPLTDNVLQGSAGHLAETPHEKVKTPAWVTDSLVQKLDVRFTPTATEQIAQFSPDSVDAEFKLNLFTSVCELQTAVRQVLNEDPRSVYRRNKCRDSLYYFAIDNVHMTVWFDDSVAEVLKIQPVSHVPHCVT